MLILYLHFSHGIICIWIQQKLLSRIFNYIINFNFLSNFPIMSKSLFEVKVTIIRLKIMPYIYLIKLLTTKVAIFLGELEILMSYAIVFIFHPLACYMTTSLLLQLKEYDILRFFLCRLECILLDIIYSPFRKLSSHAIIYCCW